MGAPYSGDPTKYWKQITLIDDSDTPDAAAFGPGWEGAIDNAAYLYGARQHPGQNWRQAWPPSQIDTSGDPLMLQAAKWDPNTNLWLIAMSRVVTSVCTLRVFFATGIDDGLQSAWTLIGDVGSDGSGGSSAFNEADVVADPTTSGAAWAAGIERVSQQLIVAVGTEGHLAGFTTKRTVATSGGMAHVHLATLASGVVIYATGGNGANTVLSSTSNGGSSWSDFTPSWIVPLSATTDWALVSNGTSCIAAPTNWTPGSPGVLFTTTDGVTWTQQSLSFIGAHDQILGLVWQPLELGGTGQWVMMVQTATTSSPATCAIYTSPDGVTWTKLATGPKAQTLADLGTCANGLCAALADAASGGPSGMIFSPDLGATWYPSQGGFPTNSASGTPGYTRTRIASSPTGMLAFNNNWARFTPYMGLPPGPLATS